MNKVLHVSIRATDPRNFAEMFANLLDGEVRDNPLSAWDVVCVYTGAGNSWLQHMLEFWPSDKHWHLGKMEQVDVQSQRSYCHVAFVCDKPYTTIKSVAEAYGMTVLEENRDLDQPIPVLYDDLGNYFEFFPSRHFAEGLGS